MIYQCFDTQTGREVASKLLDVKAIKLSPQNPFTWASGWKSPIYCDNRLSLSFPDVRTFVKEKLSAAVQQFFAEADVIAGVATAGIPQGALIADYLELPFAYVRSKSKSHGLTNQIEGKIEAGQKVVVVEDLVSTGGSSLAAVQALKDAGADVLGMVAIFTYGFPVALNNFKEANVDLVYLSEYEILLQEALQKKYIEQDTLQTLSKWREDPGSWRP
jgi:orotate phosphoribosyltransferase